MSIYSDLPYDPALLGHILEQTRQTKPERILNITLRESELGLVMSAMLGELENPINFPPDVRKMVDKELMDIRNKILSQIVTQ